MGEAKKRQKQLREEFTRILDSWAFAPSDSEAQTVTEVQALPSITVEREPPERLEWARMKPRLCHDNCAWYQRNDPTREAKAVVGWLVEPTGNYVLHSVVSVGREYRCITPMPGEPSRFQFIPDPDIVVERIEADNRYRITRKGFEVGAGIRPDPQKTLRHIGIIQERLASGMDPIKAMDLKGLD
jgi:hypothetical protein